MLKTLRVDSSFTCAQHCLGFEQEKEECQSFNYKNKAASNAICELNNSTTSKDYENTVDDDDFSYFEVICISYGLNKKKISLIIYCNTYVQSASGFWGKSKYYPSGRCWYTATIELHGLTSRKMLHIRIRPAVTFKWSVRCSNYWATWTTSYPGSWYEVAIHKLKWYIEGNIFV